MPPTISPAPNSSIKLHALFIAISTRFGSMSFSNLEDASVLNPSFLEVSLIEVPSKFAHSNIMVFVSFLISEFSPPITPATATGFLSSAITSIDEFKVLSSPSKVLNFSLSSAFLTIILLPSINL